MTSDRDPFDGAKAKVARALELEAECDALLRQFVTDGGLGSPTVDVDRFTREVQVAIPLNKPMPRALRTRAADALYNVRSALDGALVRAIVLCGHPANTVYFPHGKTVEAFETSFERHTKKLVDEGRQFIRGVQPYYGGQGSILQAIHDWNIHDKHQDLIAPAAYALQVVENSSLTPLQRLAEYDGKALVAMGRRIESHTVTMGFRFHDVDADIDQLTLGQALKFAANKVGEVIDGLESALQSAGVIKA